MSRFFQTFRDLLDDIVHFLEERDNVLLKYLHDVIKHYHYIFIT